MIKLIRLTVGLPAKDHALIGELSLSRCVPRADIVRDAVGYYLERIDTGTAGHNGAPAISADFARIALTTEFTQAAVDVLLRETAPEKRDEILLTVEQRMEQFHGQK